MFKLDIIGKTDILTSIFDTSQLASSIHSSMNRAAERFTLSLFEGASDDMSFLFGR